MTHSKHKIISLAETLASEFDILAHELRVLILAIIAAHGRITWTDLKSVLESIVGPVNPNTLAFHVRKLINSKYVEREGGPESVIYKARIPDDVKRKIEPLVKEIKSYLEKGG